MIYYLNIYVPKMEHIWHGHCYDNSNGHHTALRSIELLVQHQHSCVDLSKCRLQTGDLHNGKQTVPSRMTQTNHSNGPYLTAYVLVHVRQTSVVQWRQNATSVLWHSENMCCQGSSDPCELSPECKSVTATLHHTYYSQPDFSTLSACVHTTSAHWSTWFK